MFTSLIRRAPAALSWRAACRQARALVVCALPLAACATHPPATSLDRPVSHALSADIATPLRDALASPEAAHPGQSGFRLLADGATALQMRIALARAATKTLDMQYYIATEDTTGKLLLAAALYAADRGVRADAGRRSELPRYRSRDGRAQHAPEHRDPRVQPVRRIAARHGRAHGQLLHADRQLHAPDAQQGDDRGQPARDRRRPQSRRRILQCGRHCSSAISTCWPPAP